MGHPFDGVLDGMGKIVHGIDTPFIPRVMVAHVDDPVHGRVPHIHIGGSHIDLGPQGPAAIGEFPVFHPLEQVQIFLHAPVPPRAISPGLR